MVNLIGGLVAGQMAKSDSRFGRDFAADDGRVGTGRILILHFQCSR